MVNKLKSMSFSLLGPLTEFRNNPLKLMDSLRILNEDKAIIRFANIKIHVLFHPELIKEVLVTKQKSFQKSTIFAGLKIIIGDGLLTSENPKNRKQRKLIQPSFTRSHLLSVFIY
ncbi:cytochrome P450 [Bacillus sp. 7884-1]|uniref:cytochrome P450 n=1 Tax=Bacillus sp. 7884-1 TaxID=2021693 RepID=UPI0011551392|nr:cytochrome P450 [Bacillus sp. 7884-1]